MPFEFLDGHYNLLVLFASAVTPRQGSAGGDSRRQLMAGGLDVPDGARPIPRQESSSSIAVSRHVRQHKRNN